MKLDFINAVSHKRTMLLAFEVEFTECILDALSYSESTIGPTMVETEEKFSK